MRLAIRPKGFKYKWIKIEKDAQISEIMYQYKEENILYTISAMQSNNSMGLDADDKEVDKYMKKSKWSKYKYTRIYNFGI